MLTRLIIENFRGLRRFDAEFDASTVLLGPNSSGKTSVLHAIRLAGELAERLANDAETRLGMDAEPATPRLKLGEAIINDPFALLPFPDWRALFVDADTTHPIRIHLDFDTRAEGHVIERIELQLARYSNEQLKASVVIDSGELRGLLDGVRRISSQLRTRLIEHVTRHLPKAVLVPPFYGAIREEEYRVRAVVDRLLGAGDQSHVVRNLIVRLEPAQLVRLDSFLQATVGARIRRRTGRDDIESSHPLVVGYSDSNGELELATAGAGLVNLISLFASLSRWEQAARERALIFLLDEPEAHLHPRLQAESAERLSRLVTEDFGAQLVAATHSVDIINRLGDRGARLLRVDRQREPGVLAIDGHSALMTELAAWADLTPFTAINFLAARRVVFVEGPHDKRAIERLADTYFRSNQRDRPAFDRWILVTLGSVTHAPSARLLTRLLATEAVTAQARTGAFKVVIVTDPDARSDAPAGITPEADIEAPVQAWHCVWPGYSIESLLIEPIILAQWLMAFAEGNWPDLARHVDRAVAAADVDDDLNDPASDRRVVALIARARQADPRRGNSDEAIKEAMRTARAAVRADPARWQRGKDRARFVLGHLRGLAPAPVAAKLPTNVLELLQQTPLDRLPSPTQAVPVPIRSLFAHLVSEA
ncbi:MAG: AAA family ATPase [Myxococcales bacterium]|nr:AAA family ATPase [Myxococcales bacterium]